MVVHLVAFTAADRFFKFIMGRRRNELRNAASLVLKLRIFVAVQDLIISFYTQKVQFTVICKSIETPVKSKIFNFSTL